MTPDGRDDAVRSRLTLAAHRRWIAIVALVAALVPPAVAWMTIETAGARFPFGDQWETVPMLERATAGTLGWPDLWRQQNEHRYVIPWLLILGLARLTGWNFDWELRANLIVSLLTLALLAALVVRTCRRSAPMPVPWLVLGASAMVFSLAKWENWLWNAHAEFLNLFFVCVTVAILAWWGAAGLGPVLATLGAIAASVCFGSGLLLLGLVPLGLALDPRVEARRRLVSAAASAVGGLVFAFLYSAGFERPAKHPTPWRFLSDPVGLVTYVLGWVGAPLGWPSVPWSVAWGALGLVAPAVATVWLWRRRPGARAHVLPWALLSLYVVLTGVLIGVGRLGLGLGQALSSRYTTLSTFHWIAVSVLVTLAATAMLDDASIPRRRALAVLALAVAVVGGAAASYASVAVGVGGLLPHLEALHTRALECVRFYRQASDDCLRFSHPDPGLVRDRAARLERLGLGPFREAWTLRPLASYERAATPRAAGWIDAVRYQPFTLPMLGVVYREVEVTVYGWAMDPITRRAATAVLIVVDGVVVERVPTGNQRDDVARAAGEALRSAGWSARFTAFRLPPHPTTLDAYAVLDDGRIARLAGSRRFDGAPAQ